MNPTTFLLLAILAIAVVALLVVGSRGSRFRKQGNLNDQELPYEKVQSVLTPAEHRFYDVLQTAARSEDLAVLIKVRQADLVEVRRGTEHRQAHQNRIQQKHVDVPR